jgi:hypothetical protein
VQAISSRPHFPKSRSKSELRPSIPRPDRGHIPGPTALTQMIDDAPFRLSGTGSVLHS